jgi:hypothetical protein
MHFFQQPKEISNSRCNEVESIYLFFIRAEVCTIIIPTIMIHARLLATAKGNFYNSRCNEVEVYIFVFYDS